MPLSTHLFRIVGGVVIPAHDRSHVVEIGWMVRDRHLRSRTMAIDFGSSCLELMVRS